MFKKYFQEWEVKPEYKKEFISIWKGWLGEENLHKLDEVGEEDWSKFNIMIRLISKKYKILLADFPNQKLVEIKDIENTLSNYENSMNKNSEQFSNYVIPELDCVISEEWDYTYILWYKKNEVINKLEPIINEVGLFNFNE